MSGETKNYLQYNEFSLKLFGMHSFADKNSTKIIKFLSPFYAVLTCFMILQGSIPCLINSYMKINNDTKTIVYSLSDVLDFIFVFIQFCYFKTNETALNDVVENMYRKFRFSSAPGVTMKTMDESLKLSNKILVFWLVGCLLSAGLTAFLPIINQANAAETLSAMVWYPFEFQNSSRFYFVFAAQAIGQLYNGIVFFCVDSFFLCVMILTCGQFEVLKCSLRNIRYTAMLNHGQSKTQVEKFSQYFNHLELSSKTRSNQIFNANSLAKEINQCYTNIYDKQIDEAVKSCVEHHQDILDHCNILEEFLSPLMMGKLAYVTGFLCMLAYQASTTNDFYTMLRHLEYIGIISTELFLYTFTGQILTETSLTIGDAIYEGPWYIFNSKTKKSFQLIIMRSLERPVILRALKFYELTTDTFIKIMKASFSYYTLLKSMNN